MKILCIPDSHVGQNQDLKRFAALGNFILEHKPDTIVQMGDFLSLASLSHWDSSKRLKMEGRRYRADIDAGKEAIRLMLEPTQQYRFKWTGPWKLAKDKCYTPDWYWLYGNHECTKNGWLGRYLEQNPELADHLDIAADLGLPSYFKQVAYKDYVNINDILFTHAPIVGGQAVSGKYALRRAADITSKSIVFAHIHRFETMAVHRHGSGKLIQVLGCGSFFDEPDDYMEGSIQDYWKGVVLLDSWEPGRFDITQVSLEQLYRRYL